MRDETYCTGLLEALQHIPGGRYSIPGTAFTTAAVLLLCCTRYSGILKRSTRYYVIIILHFLPYFLGDKLLVLEITVGKFLGVETGYLRIPYPSL